MRLKLASFLPAGLALCVLLASQPRSRAADADYEPVGLAQESVMTATLFTPDGKQIVGSAHRKFDEVVQKNGKTYFRCHLWTEGWTQNFDMNEMVRKDDQGIYVLEEKADAAEETDVVLPLKVGSTWSHTSSGQTKNDSVVELQDITIKGKVYPQCFHLRTVMADGSYTEDYWDAPGLGTIKSETVFKSGAKILLEISSFTPGK